MGAYSAYGCAPSSGHVERRSLKEVRLVALRQGARRSAARAIRPAVAHARYRSALRTGSSQREDRYLQSLAERWGIDTSYVDMTGSVCHVPRETLKAILQIRGCVATKPRPGRTAKTLSPA